MSSSDIHVTCDFPGENIVASLANHERLKNIYFKNTSFG